MNFVGHAMVARWRGADPGFVLGAMLPDLARMCAGRLLASDDDEISAGMSFHHRTDAVFHQAPTFLALCSTARAELRTAGVARGCAIAAAHVGIELLLDGVWLDRLGVADAYLEAVAYTQRLPDDALRWRAPEHARRFERLCARMYEMGVPDGYRDPVEVGHRLHRILADRPRLAPGPGDEQRLIEWTCSVDPDIASAASSLESELRPELVRDGDRN